MPRQIHFSDLYFYESELETVIALKWCNYDIHNLYYPIKSVPVLRCFM